MPINSLSSVKLEQVQSREVNLTRVKQSQLLKDYYSDFLKNNNSYVAVKSFWVDSKATFSINEVRLMNQDISVVALTVGLGLKFTRNW